MYAFWSKTELVPVFQSTGTLVLNGIPAESGRNVQPSTVDCSKDSAMAVS
jgi:hypothetical protein